MKRIPFLATAAAAICLVAFPAAQTAKPRAAAKKEQAVPFKVGEKLTYDIGWSSYVTAGTATMTVQEKKPSYGSTAYYIAAEGKPTPLLSNLYTLYYKVDTLLDVYSLLPQRGSLYSEEGRRRRMKSMLFNQSARTAKYEVKTATLVQKNMKIAPYSQDALSALYVLRSIPLKSGDKFNMPVADNGNLYTVQMVVGNVEQVSSGIGKVQAIKVSPVIRASAGEAPPARGFTIWFTTDARKLPVKMQAQLAVGAFTLTLSQASGL
jgi:hypothetical protein